MGDSMTDAELDSTDPRIFAKDGRIHRISQGSGVTYAAGKTLVEEYMRMAEVWQKMKKMAKKGKGMSNQKHQLEQSQRSSSTASAANGRCWSLAEPHETVRKWQVALWLL